MGVLLLGGVGTVIASTVVTHRAETHAEEWLSERAEVVEREVNATVIDLVEDMTSVAAFMETAGDVDKQRFADFVNRLDKNIGLIGVAYLPIVPAADVDEFVEQARAELPTFAITSLEANGAIVPLEQEREVYYPVRYFAPGRFLFDELPAEDSPLEIGVGVDAGSNPVWASSLFHSLAMDAPTVSEFIPITFQDVSIGQAFVVMSPVHGGDGEPIGAVAAPMLDWLLPTKLDVSITSNVQWEINPPSVVGDDPRTAALVWTGEIVLPGVTWQLVVEPTDKGKQALGGTPAWAIWAIGLTITGAVAGLTHLIRLRSRSRARLSEMQRMSEEKDRFLAAVSHEIRTPLTAVAGLAHELSERPHDFELEEFQSLLGTVAEQSDEVAAIVEDLLVAARSDIGNVTVHHGIIDVLSELTVAIETAGVHVDVVGIQPPPAWADAQRVRQILRNLLTNADRYGGDRIEVRFEADEDSVSVTVADSGSPIPIEDRHKIFEPYTSAHQPIESVGAIGLGLFISRELSTIMGGQLHYRHDGEWGMFTLTIPRSLAPATEAPPRPEEMAPGTAEPHARRSA